MVKISSDNNGIGGTDAGQDAYAPASGQASTAEIRMFEQQIEALLNALESRNGTQGAGSGAPAGVMPGQAAPAGQSSAGATSPSVAGTGGGTMSVDGAKPGGDTVAMQVVNNSGKDEHVALTNAQNQTFAAADLKPGQKETFLLDPNDPNTKSARMQTTNADGSLRQDAKLTEFNLQPGHTAINVSNNNFAGVTGTDGNAVDAEQMQINDNQGMVAGDGAANGAYRNSVDDANAMIMGDDSAKNFTVTIS